MPGKIWVAGLGAGRNPGFWRLWANLDPEQICPTVGRGGQCIACGCGSGLDPARNGRPSDPVRAPGNLVAAADRGDPLQTHRAARDALCGDAEVGREIAGLNGSLNFEERAGTSARDGDIESRDGAG